jgi:hypothetical protein
MHKSHIITPVAIVSSVLSIVFSVLLALSALAGHVGAGIGTKTLAVALALVFEAAKFGFAAEAVRLLRDGAKTTRAVGITCASVSAALFGLSTVSSVSYVQHLGGELKAQEAQAMQKMQHAAAAQSQAAQDARTQITGIEREREILRRQIASTQDTIDRDIADGYRTRATQSMAHMEHLKAQLRMLDDKEADVKKEQAEAEEQAAQAVVQEPSPVPTDAMASVLGIMLEVVSMLSVVVASMQRGGDNTRTTTPVAQPQPRMVEAVQEQPQTLHTQALSDVPEVVRTMPNPTYRAIAKTLGCSQHKARDIARRVKEMRAQHFVHA